jgi:hypothetical protein
MTSHSIPEGCIRLRGAGRQQRDPPSWHRLARFHFDYRADSKNARRNGRRDIVPVGKHTRSLVKGESGCTPEAVLGHINLNSNALPQERTEKYVTFSLPFLTIGITKTT